jgi:hypothetical protein
VISRRSVSTQAALLVLPLAAAQTAGGSPTADVREAEAAHWKRAAQNIEELGCIVFPPANPNMAPQERKRFLELLNFAAFPFHWSSYEPDPGKPHWQFRADF